MRLVNKQDSCCGSLLTTPAFALSTPKDAACSRQLHMSCCCADGISLQASSHSPAKACSSLSRRYVRLLLSTDPCRPAGCTRFVLTLRGGGGVVHQLDEPSMLTLAMHAACRKVCSLSIVHPALPFDAATTAGLSVLPTCYVV